MDPVNGFDWVSSLEKLWLRVSPFPKIVGYLLRGLLLRKLVIGFDVELKSTVDSRSRVSRNGN